MVKKIKKVNSLKKKDVFSQTQTKSNKVEQNRTKSIKVEQQLYKRNTEHNFFEKKMFFSQVNLQNSESHDIQILDLF